jgi:putative transposase/transposase-like zinc-binding protein
MTPLFQRPALELAEVVRRHGPRLGEDLSGEQRRILRAIVSCRTAALGGHVETCDQCQYRRIAYNSCRNRHCPRCQASACAQWMEDRAEELLPVQYFHVVFTLPDTFNALALGKKRTVYGVLFNAVSQTLSAVAANPRHLGARIGFIGILHTWGQNLSLHPHIHCVVPGGGVSPDGSRWIACKPGFFLPVRVLSKVFRGKFIDLLKQARADGKLPGAENDGDFTRLLNTAVKHDWVVYAKPPFGGPEQVLKYLSRYTHRIAISNRRLVSIDDQTVTFNWKDYAHNNRPGTMTLDGKEFLRRFLLHAVPSGFMRIRHFGLLANRTRTQNLQTCRRLLSVPSPLDADSGPTPLAIASVARVAAHVCCRVCGRGRMIPGPNLSPLELRRLTIRLDSS